MKTTAKARHKKLVRKWKLAAARLQRATKRLQGGRILRRRRKAKHKRAR